MDNQFFNKYIVLALFGSATYWLAKCNIMVRIDKIKNVLPFENTGHSKLSNIVMLTFSLNISACI